MEVSDMSQCYESALWVTSESVHEWGLWVSVLWVIAVSQQGESVLWVMAVSQQWVSAMSEGCKLGVSHGSETVLLVRPVGQLWMSAMSQGGKSMYESELWVI